MLNCALILLVSQLHAQSLIICSKIHPNPCHSLFQSLCAFAHPLIYALTRSCTHSLSRFPTLTNDHLHVLKLVQSFNHSPIRSLSHSLTHWLTDCLARSLAHSLTHSLTHILINLSTYSCHKRLSISQRVYRVCTILWEILSFHNFPRYQILTPGICIANLVLVYIFTYHFFIILTVARSVITSETLKFLQLQT